MNRRIAVGVACAVLSGGQVCSVRADTPALVALQQTNAASQNGLCLYLGATSEKPLLQFAAGSRLQVQALLADREAATRLRTTCQNGPDASRISVVWRRTAHLPYLDDLVDMVVAENWGAGDLKDLALSEVVRVLQPGGVAILGSDDGKDASALLAAAGKVKLAKAEALLHKGAWIRIVKQLDPRYGEWPDSVGQPDQTGICKDSMAGPAREIRWINGPTWSSYTTFHDVVAGGRDYHLVKEWVNPTLSQWVLVARNAHNGCDLWRVKLGDPRPPDWQGDDRSLCADEQRVYHNEDGKFVARDAVTGVKCLEYGKSQGWATPVGPWLLTPAGLIDKQSAKLLLPLGCSGFHCRPAIADSVAYTIRSSGAQGDVVEAVQLPDGKSLWKTPVKDFDSQKNKSDLHLACRGENVLLTLNGIVVALERASGKVRWTYQPAAPLDSCIAMALPEHVALKYRVPSGKTNGMAQILLDAKTGREVGTARAAAWLSARCFPAINTDRYFLIGDGVFVDQLTLAVTNQAGFRPTCGAGAAAAYGLIYNGPHYCSCLVALRGWLAYSPGSAVPDGTVAAPLLTLGAAPAGAAASSNDWPTYRCDALRSDNFGGNELPAQLKLRWSAKLGDTAVPQATSAAGLVFVADTEQRRVKALALDSGKEKWSFATEGRVSVAPTYFDGLCLFGDHAGYVYALEATTGRLVWQLLAAPEQKLMCAFGQIESAWPVLSGVLVFKRHALFVAGRCGKTDGGMYCYDVEALTGKVLKRMPLNDARPADILMTDGREVFLPVSREAKDQENPLSYNPDPAQDDALPPAQQRLRAGGTWYQMAVLNAIDSLDPGMTANRKRNLSVGSSSGDLLAFDNRTNHVITTARARGKSLKPEEVGQGLVLCKGKSKWTNKETHQQMQALLLAGPRVYCAGTPEFRDPQQKPALWILSTADGSVQQKLPLDSAPSIDGLSAADRCVLLSTTDGRILCFEGPR